MQFEPGSRRIRSGRDDIKLPTDGTITFRQIAGTKWCEYSRVWIDTEVNGEKKGLYATFPDPIDSARRVLLPSGKTFADLWPKRQVRYRAVVLSRDEKAVMILDAPGGVFKQIEKMLTKYGPLDGFDLSITGETTGNFTKYTVNTPPKGDQPLDEDTLARIAGELLTVQERLEPEVDLADMVERIPGASLLEATEDEMNAEDLARSVPPEDDN